MNSIICTKNWYVVISCVVRNSLVSFTMWSNLSRELIRQWNIVGKMSNERINYTFYFVLFGVEIFSSFFRVSLEKKGTNLCKRQLDNPITRVPNFYANININLTFASLLSWLSRVRNLKVNMTLIKTSHLAKGCVVVGRSNTCFPC